MPPSSPDFPRVPIDRSQTRSMVISTRGIVASEHPFASQAGAGVLAAGGHAVDAAIAANAVMGVVSPMMCGVGGDLFAIVSDTAGLHGLNASGWAPARLTPAFLESKGFRGMPQSGVHSITAPGAVAGWALLHEKFGNRPFASLLEPAMTLAADGFPVAEITAAEWRNAAAFLSENPDAAAAFLPHGNVPGVGSIFRNPGLAATYRTIARGGAEEFYRGPVADALVHTMNAHGGVMSGADLSDFRGEWVTPIQTTYRGWDVFEIPPNGAGIAALMMLNILEQFPLSESGHNSVEALHLLIEAKKLGYADMQRYVGDPRQSPVQTRALLSKEYARTRAAAIDRRQAHQGGSAGALAAYGGDTVYLSVVDRHGNMVSLIQSNFASFGSGIVAPGTGFVLQNRGALFTLDPSHPNVLAPRKRPLHTIIPGFMQKARTRVAFGIMGGWNQSQAHAQFVSNLADHGMNIQAALEAPRVAKLTFDGRDVVVESRIADQVRGGLAARGHDVIVQGEFSSQVGGGQAVLRDDEAGVNYGASDPRKDGAAIPEAVS